MTVILLSEITPTAKNDNINVFFLSRFSSLADSKGNTSPVRKAWRGLREKEKRGRLVKQHMAPFHWHFSAMMSQDMMP